MPLPETSEAAAPSVGFVVCTHTLCASRASLYARCSGDVPPPASAATARAGFSPCPKFSWHRVTNSQVGNVLTSHNSCEMLSRGCEQAVAESRGPCANKAISVKPEVRGQCLAERLHRCCLAFAGARCPSRLCKHIGEPAGALMRNKGLRYPLGDVGSPESHWAGYNTPM